MKMLWSGLLTLVVLLTPAFAQSKNKQVPTIRVTVTVVNPAGRRVQGALVVLKQLRDHKGQIPRDPFNIDTHTDEHGTVVVQGFEPGVVLVQVIDTAYNTWGQAFIMKKANESVHVKLTPPQAQVSTCCR
ncbi:MAG: hypothetical protein ACRD0Y_05630 [Terriglobales bacterium]